jgi:hypothetical protein
MLLIPRVLLMAIGGGLAASLLWLLLNGMPGQAQPGRLEQHPWPISSLPVCALLGAALGALQAAGNPPQRREKALADTAERLRLRFAPTVVPEDLGDNVPLRGLANWAGGENRLYGQFEGVHVQMVDLTTSRRTAAQAGNGPAYSTSHTLVIFATPTGDWPLFEIHPRGMATWMWDLLGCRGAGFRFRDPDSTLELDRTALVRFNRRYRVFVGLAERIAEMAGMALGLRMGSEPAERVELADRFTMHTLRQFGESRGWTVESCGTHVAFWQQGKIIPAAQREAFLQQAVGLYRALAAPARDAADANLEIEPPYVDRSLLGRRLSGMIAGALVGIIVAVSLCVPLLLAVPDDMSRAFFFAWPFVGFAFMALGAYCGSRLTAPNHRTP